MQTERVSACVAKIVDRLSVGAVAGFLTNPTSTCGEVQCDALPGRAGQRMPGQSPSPKDLAGPIRQCCAGRAGCCAGCADVSSQIQPASAGQAPSSRAHARALPNFKKFSAPVAVLSLLIILLLAMPDQA